jgi:N6-L-threonylcarbamoyladenine synthase
MYGGVVPEIASRKHIEAIGYVVESALSEAGVSKNGVDAIAVTNSPGLVGALLVGMSYAKGLSFVLKKPLIGVNHVEGHICANYLNEKKENSVLLEPPFMSLVVSGGHTHLVLVHDYGKYTVLGRTRDDAAGEAYDKIARALGLSYPGGPAIERLAQEGNPDAVAFPKAMTGGYNFSFSGLKSSVLNYLNKARMSGTEISVPDVAASFQKAVISVLVEKSIAACLEHKVEAFALAGGVASNRALKEAMSAAVTREGIRIWVPSPIYCTDNAAMIASCGYFSLKQGKISSLDLNAIPDIIAM